MNANFNFWPVVISTFALSIVELESTDIDTQNCDDAEHECSNFDPPSQQSQQIYGKYVWKDVLYLHKKMFPSSRFLAILGCNTTCTDRHAKKGMDTAAHTGDGFQDIIIVRLTLHENDWSFMEFLYRLTKHPTLASCATW